MKFDSHSFVIEYKTEVEEEDDSCIIIQKHGEIIVGRADGYINTLSSDFKAKYSFQSHEKMMDILQNTEVPEAINAVEKVDYGNRSSMIFVLNDDRLKIWDVRKHFRRYKNSLVKTIPNFTNYIGNSLSEMDGDLLSADMFVIKISNLEKIEAPICLINNKVNNSNRNVLINKADFVEPEIFGHCKTDGSVIFNDLRASISSKNILSINVAKRRGDCQLDGAFRSVTDFKVIDNQIVARNAGAVIFYDKRYPGVELKRVTSAFEGERPLHPKRETVYKKFQMAVWKKQIVTGMENHIALLNEHSKRAVEVEDAGRIQYVSAGEDSFCAYYDKKIMMFHPRKKSCSGAKRNEDD